MPSTGLLKPHLSRLAAASRGATAVYACLFSALCVVFVLLNELELSQPVQLWCSLIYLLFAFTLGWHAQAGGISILVFLFALTPTLNFQVSALLPLLAAPKSITGATLITGFVTGDACRRLLIRPPPPLLAWKLPNTLNLVCVLVTVSASIAIARNLWQSASMFTFDGMLYNALRFRMNAWRDDYFPLTDLFYYGIAAALINSIIMNIRESKNPEGEILKPILWGVIFAAAWGVIQNKTGIGLPHSSASGNRYSQGLGFASAGFQPDIHAFSSHMLLGVIGAWGCFYIRDRSFSRVLIFAAISMGWIGLVMSKSRGAIVLALLAYLLVLGVTLWRKSKLYFFITTTLLLFFILMTYLFHRWGLSIIPLWLIQYSESLPKLNVNNLAVLNEHFGYRAEIYRAALRMFDAFPLMGIGQSEFYRMSGFESFSKSRFLGMINGENAHNYFLQVLTETGLIGLGIFALVFLKPVLNSEISKQAMPSIFMLIAFGVGNIFAHSLLIKENLFLLCCVLALMYIEIGHVKALDKPARNCLSKLFNQTRYQFLSVIFALVLIAFAVREVYVSFGKYPYVYGLVCQHAGEVKPNEWSSGLIQIQASPTVKRIELNLSDVPPDVSRVPLVLEWFGVSRTGDSGPSQFLSIDKSGPQKLTMPILPISPSGDIIKIVLSRCFTPRNLGVNSDSRRLGVLIQNVQLIE